MSEAASLRSARLALNPIQWMASDDGWLDPSLAPEPKQLLSLVKQSGFDAVMAEVPAGCGVPEYRNLVEDVGLTLAPGYVTCRSDGRDGNEAETLSRAAAAARQHAELGLREIGLGLGMGKDKPRVAHPAQAYDADPARVEAVTSLISRIADVVVAEGVRPNLHPHVGTWIETEAEARAVLDALPEDRLGFLPDTGRLTCAGSDVGAFIKDHELRIPFVHVKDCRLSVAARGGQEDGGYQQTVLAGLWAEPGRGELDLTGILTNLPSTFDGYLMVE